MVSISDAELVKQFLTDALADGYCWKETTSKKRIFKYLTPLQIDEITIDITSEGDPVLTSVRTNPLTATDSTPTVLPSSISYSEYKRDSAESAVFKKSVGWLLALLALVIIIYGIV